ncbi:MAG: aspartate/glutamate racemase family protein [Pseudomonadota bacterium]
MHIGLIGGIGVASTVVYYQRLAAALAARETPLSLTIVQAEVRDLIRTNSNDLREEQAETYAPLLARLEAAGADCAAITSIGGHFCYAETVARSPLPMVSAIKPLDAYFVGEGLARVGLLGTRVVMRTRLYGALAETEAVALDDRIDEIGGAYQDLALAGRATEADRTLFIEAGRRLVEEEGAAAVVLAGTDLNLVFEGVDPGYRVIDALDVHVALLAQLAADEITLAEANADGL